MPEFYNIQWSPACLNTACRTNQNLPSNTAMLRAREIPITVSSQVTFLFPEQNGNAIKECKREDWGKENNRVLKVLSNAETVSLAHFSAFTFCLIWTYSKPLVGNRTLGNRQTTLPLTTIHIFCTNEKFQHVF